MTSIFMADWFVPAVIGFVVVVTLIPLFLILRKSRRRRLSQPIRGTLLVTSGSYPPHGTAAANFQLSGVLTGPTIQPTAVQRSGIARVSKWPSPGMTLAVEYEATNPQIFNILWSEVASGAQRAAQTAQQLAQQMGAVGGQVTPGINHPQGGYPAFQAPTVNGATAFPATGMATITSVALQPATDGNTHAQLGSQVQPDTGGTPFMATLSIAFRPESAQLQQQICQTGARVPVRFHPSNPMLVVPDTERMPT